MDLLTVLTWFSGVAFIYFGINCFVSKYILAEFNRYKLPQFRKLTGYLQILGALGLIIGLYFSPLLLIASATGLCLLMLAGFMVRLKIRDNFIKASPSFTFAILNLGIALKAYFQYF